MPVHSQSDSVLLAAGRRGRGKSSLILQHARGFGRVLAWDPKNEYARGLGVRPITRPTELVERLREPRLVFVPEVVTPELFELVCEIVWKHRHGSLFIAEELADVSNPGKARGYWGRIIREGRHSGISVAAATQRPTEIDSTTLSNATRLAVFHMRRLADRKLMAAELDVDVSMVSSLGKLEFLDADDETGTVTRRKLQFAR